MPFLKGPATYNLHGELSPNVYEILYTYLINSELQYAYSIKTKIIYDKHGIVNRDEFLISS